MASLGQLACLGRFFLLIKICVCMFFLRPAARRQSVFLSGDFSFGFIILQCVYMNEYSDLILNYDILNGNAWFDMRRNNQSIVV